MGSHSESLGVYFARLGSQIAHKSYQSATKQVICQFALVKWFGSRHKAGAAVCQLLYNASLPRSVAAHTDGLKAACWVRLGPRCCSFWRSVSQRRSPTVPVRWV